MQRRSFLGGLAAAAIPATAVVAEVNSFDWNAFMAESTPEQLASFYSNGLTETMAKLHPDRSWRCAIDHKNQFVLVVGDKRPGVSA